MCDMAQESYVVAAEENGYLVARDGPGEPSSTKVLSVFSSRDLAPKDVRDTGDTKGPRRTKEVPLDDLRQILICARDEGYTHVTLDGREMEIDGFRTLLDHERLE